MTEHMAIQDQFFAYLDGDLDANARATVAEHVERCSDCAHELDMARRANQLFQTVQPQALPDGFMARLQARIQETSPLTVVDVDEVPRNGHVEHGGNGKVLQFSPIEATQARSTARAKRSSWKIWTALAAVFAVLLGIGHLFISSMNPSTITDVSLAPAALAYSEGTVKLGREGDAKAVQEDVALQPGDSLSTSADAKAIITLGNMGSVRLAPNTRMRVVALNTFADNGRVDVKIQLESGSIWVEESGGVHCSLKAGDALIVPTGTSYEATVDGGNAQVNVWEGSVDVSSLSNIENRMQLAAGQQADVAPAGAMNVHDLPADAGNNDFQKWNRQVQNPPHPMSPGPLATPSLQPSPRPMSWQNRQTTPPSTQPAATTSAPAASTRVSTPGMPRLGNQEPHGPRVILQHPPQRLPATMHPTHNDVHPSHNPALPHHTNPGVRRPAAVHTPADTGHFEGPPIRHETTTHEPNLPAAANAASNRSMHQTMNTPAGHETIRERWQQHQAERNNANNHPALHNNANNHPMLHNSTNNNRPMQPNNNTHHPVLRSTPVRSTNSHQWSRPSFGAGHFGGNNGKPNKHER